MVEAGLHFDMSAEDYFSDPCPEPSVTQSLLRTLIDRSPRHAWFEHPRLNPDFKAEENTKFDIGNAAHRLLIGRGKMVNPVPFDNWSSKDAKKARAALAEVGVIAVLEHQYDRAEEMAEAVRQQLRSTEHAEAFVSGHGEVVACWRDEGFWCRTMIDWFTPDFTQVYDLKTTSMSCSPYDVAERPSVEGWDIQGAWHEAALETLHPDNPSRRKHYFVAIENQPPYALTVVQLSEADLTMGRKKIAYALTRWKICMARKSWPGYPRSTVMSQPRGYTETKWLQREVAEASSGNILEAG